MAPADSIKTFVLDNVRRGDSDTAEYVKEHWNEFRAKGLWFFLFDSFDEIPSVLHAPSGSNIIDDHATAIRHFMQGMGACRGVIASREFKGPRNLTWPKLKLMPLSQKKQNELVLNSFLPSDLQDMLASYLLVTESRLPTNPLFLALLCRYVKEERKLPRHDHELLFQHIKRLAGRDSSYVSRQFGHTATEILAAAETLAVVFAEDPLISLAPTRDEIAAALGRAGKHLNNLDSTLSALVYVKIGRCDVPNANEGDRRFTFGHRRFQECLYVDYLARCASEADRKALLLDPRWREYAVTLLQTQSEASVALLIRAAETILGTLPNQTKRILPRYGGHLFFYQWSKDDQVAHILSILHDGLSGRRQCISGEVRQLAAKCLEERWAKGDIFDRIRVIEHGALLTQADLLSKIQWAIERGPTQMKDAAFVACEFLDRTNKDVCRWIRARLADRLLCGTSESHLRRIAALAARMPKDIGAPFICERCSLLWRRTSKWLMRPLSGLPYEFTASRQPVAALVILELILLLCGASYSVSDSHLIADTFSFCAFLSFVFIAAGILVFLLLLYVTRSVGEPISAEHVLSAIRSLNFSGKALHRWARMLIWISGLVLLPGLIIEAVLVHSLGTPLSAMGYFGAALTAIFGLGICIKISESLRERRSLRRLRSISAQEDDVPLALRAACLVELKLWLESRKVRLLKGENELRSLLALLGAGPKQPLPVPIRTAPLFQQKWNSSDNKRVVRLIVGELYHRRLPKRRMSHSARSRASRSRG